MRNDGPARSGGDGLRRIRLPGGIILIAVSIAFANARADDAAPPGPPAVPVTVVNVVRKNVPIYRTGIGTVQALNNVLVRARVDGTLESLAFTEGQEVKKGDLIAIIDPRPYQAVLDQALAKRAQDQAMLENARLDLARYTNLARSDFASRQSVDTQQSAVNQYTAAVQGDNAAIETAALNLSFTHVTSPLEGRIGLRQTDPGNLIHANDTQGLVTIAQVHPINVVFTLPEDVLPAVLSAMTEGKLPAYALSSDNRTRLSEGTLLTPDNTIDSSTGTIRLKAVFQNADNKLWPGQFVSIRLQIGLRQNVMTVPSSAVQRSQDGLFVFTVKDNQSSLRPVQEAFEQDGIAVIETGLTGDEAVVVSGQSRIANGSRVNAKLAASGTGS